MARSLGGAAHSSLAGGAFRPLEHFLTDRRGRRLDAEQIAMFQSAIWAVREPIRMAPALDAALAGVLETTLGFEVEAGSTSRQQALDRPPHSGDVVRHGLPDDSELHDGVSVDEPVPHADRRSPVDPGNLGAELGRELTDGLGR